MGETHEIGSAAWNDMMYSEHSTPYGKGLAGWIQVKRVKRVIEYAGIRPTDRVLEIGCERGKLCAALPPCVRIVGCDISLQALADAKRLFAEQKRSAEFFLVDAVQGLPFERGEFDVIICSEMLEHVTDPIAAIGNIRQVCTAETRVVLTVPIEARKVTIKRLLQRLGVLELLFPGIEPRQSVWHLQAFSKAHLHRLTAPFFIWRKSSSVWGCHLVALLQLKVAGCAGP